MHLHLLVVAIGDCGQVEDGVLDGDGPQGRTHLVGHGSVLHTTWGGGGQGGDRKVNSWGWKVSKLVGVKGKLVGVESKLMGVESKLMGVEIKLVGVEIKLVGVESKLVGVEKASQESSQPPLSHHIIGIPLPPGPRLSPRHCPPPLGPPPPTSSLSSSPPSGPPRLTTSLPPHPHLRAPLGPHLAG